MKSQTFIVLLRGINVSGQKLIRMEVLKKAFADAGFANVRTYIQSGNVIADFAANANATRDRAVKLIADGFGFDVEVVILTPPELRNAIEALPFDGPGNKVYMVFLSDIPDASVREQWQQMDWGLDKTALHGRVVYVHYGESAGKSKLTTHAIEKILGVRATARNLNTARKLLEMSWGAAR